MSRSRIPELPGSTHPIPQSAESLSMVTKDPMILSQEIPLILTVGMSYHQ